MILIPLELEILEFWGYVMKRLFISENFAFIIESNMSKIMWNYFWEIYHIVDK